ncbi:MAG: AMP-binding protein [Rhodothermales bacterium]|nr:AMP-binding protein [Rhodothermales bacterium]MBO6779610.1 AMP-binding protein [Rhodothermales bacterium]
MNPVLNLLNDAASRFGTAPLLKDGPSFAQAAEAVRDGPDSVEAGHRVGLLAPEDAAGILRMLTLLRDGCTVVLLGRREPPGRLAALEQRWGLGTRRSTGPRIVVLTSGTTGEPKGVVHTLGSLMASARGAAGFLEFGPGSHWPVTLPTHHVGGLAVLFRCLAAGGSMSFPADPRALEPIAREATHVSLVSTQLRRLLDGWVGPPPPALKRILLGGSAIPRDLCRRASQAGWSIVLSYGMSEMGSLVTAGEVGACLGSGRVLPGRRLRLDGTGEIHVGGDALFEGYLDGAPAGEWHPTGDLGVLENGALLVTGRRDNMFISGGENIQPERIEAVLLQADGVRNAIVVPVESREFGFRPVAFVEGETAGIEAAFAASLPRFMHPVAVLQWPLEDEGMKPSRVRLATTAQERLGTLA